MVRRKKSSKLIPIIFSVLIIFLAVLVVNNYVTYQGLQAQEQQYQELQQALIDDAIAEEVVEEVEEAPFSSRYYSAEDNVFLLLSLENPEIDMNTEELKFDLIQYESVTGEQDIILDSMDTVFEIFLVKENDANNFANLIGESPRSYSPGWLANTRIDLDDFCTSGCNEPLVRSKGQTKIRNEIVVNISSYLHETNVTDFDGNKCNSMEFAGSEYYQNSEKEDSLLLVLEIFTGTNKYWSTFENYNSDYISDDNNHRKILPSHTVRYEPIFKSSRVVNDQIGCVRFYNTRENYGWGSSYPCKDNFSHRCEIE